MSVTEPAAEGSAKFKDRPHWHCDMVINNLPGGERKTHISLIPVEGAVRSVTLSQLFAELGEIDMTPETRARFEKIRGEQDLELADSFARAIRSFDAGDIQGCMEHIGAAATQMLEFRNKVVCT